jgi:YD repeat-containing protein
MAGKKRSVLRETSLTCLLILMIVAAVPLLSYAQTATYHYDELNRLIRVQHLDGTVVDYYYDSAGNRTQIIHSADTTSPSVTVTINNGAASTNNASVTLTLTCSDASSCVLVAFSHDGSTYTNPEYYSSPRTWSLTSGEGTKTVYARVMDGAGNWSSASDSILLDTTAPTAAASPLGGTYTTTQTVTLTCSDTGSDCAGIYYTTDGSTPTTSSSVYTAALTISTPTTLKFFAQDTAGNASTVQSLTYTVDAQAPVTSAFPAADTYYSPQSVVLSCSDDGGTGCSAIYYTTNGSTPTTSSPVYSIPIDVSSTTTLKFFATDGIGNSESVKTEVYTIIPGIDFYTRLMLHMDGANGSTTFTDSSPSLKTVTSYGTAQTSTGQSAFGGASGYFNGSGSYLSTPDSADWNVGSGDFTIDFWVRVAAVPGTGYNLGIFSKSRSSSSRGYIAYIGPNTQNIYAYFWSNDSTMIANLGSATLPLNTWHHIAIVRSGSNFTLYTDGVASSTATSTAAVQNPTEPLKIGTLYESTITNSYFNGYIDEFRISKGVARWTGDFTPPAAPYAYAPTTTASPPEGVYGSSQTVTLSCSTNGGSSCDHTYYTTDGSAPTTSSAVYSSPMTVSATTTLKFFSQNTAGMSEPTRAETYTIDSSAVPGNDYYTKLMLHMDGADGSATFVDSSSSSKSVVAYGNGQVSTAQSKFGGASGFFDGNGDYLVVPDSDDWYLGTADFTIDLWVRFASLPASGDLQMICTQYADSSNYWDLYLHNNSGTLQWRLNSAVANASTLSTGVWYHVAVVRTGSTYRFFQDGVLIGTSTTSQTFGDYAGSLYIGKFGTYSSPYYFSGNIDELRISKGYARWTSNFTPPAGQYANSTPPGIDSYTKLALHMDGSDGSTTFTDSSSSLKSVTAYGNAQVSTAQSKFGGASGLFDGNGDYLVVPDFDDWAWPNGTDFTVDFWVRLDALPSSGSLFMVATQYVDTTHLWDLFLWNDGGTYKWYFGSPGTVVIAPAASLASGQWYHVALTRTGATYRWFQDGQQCGTNITDTYDMANYSGSLYIGRYGTNSSPYYLNGRLDEFRVSKGIARWTGNFTPPTGPYSN